MTDKTKIIPLQLSDGTIIKVEATPIGKLIKKYKNVVD
uniref:Uncharacterized protein n=1 Tax=Gloeothece verrucosa (strain PCC 7822) TaxID=497965 RepID=E0UHE5_GLOV7|nr:hypothetical protein Cyan7822_0034 [Gloeothece verrucosa PCC 7822]